MLFATGILLLLLFDDNVPIQEATPPSARPTKSTADSIALELEQSFVSANSVGSIITRIQKIRFPSNPVQKITSLTYKSLESLNNITDLSSEHFETKNGEQYPTLQSTTKHNYCTSTYKKHLLR